MNKSQKRRMQISNRHTKRQSISLGTEDMQSETTKRSPTNLLKLLKLKKKEKKGIIPRLHNNKFSYIANGN